MDKVTVIHDDIVQGEEKWQLSRIDWYGASEAAAMLGISTKLKRDEVLRSKATRTPVVYSSYTENVIFKRGHEVEAWTIEYVAKKFGLRFTQPVYSQLQPDGSTLSYSSDGVDNSNIFAIEIKQYAEELFALVDLGIVPDEYQPQMQQGMDLAKVGKCLFVVSDGTPERTVWVGVDACPIWQARIRAGWKQFNIEKLAYVIEDEEAELVADEIPPMIKLALVAVGKITQSNLPQFAEVANNFITLNKRKLVTEKDYVNAVPVAKRCRDAVIKLEAEKTRMLSTTTTIAQAVATLDGLREAFRLLAIDLEKQVEQETKRRKNVLIENASAKYHAHLAMLIQSFKWFRFAGNEPDWTTEIKHLSSVKSIKNAINTALSKSILADNERHTDCSEKAEWAEVEAGAETLKLSFTDLSVLMRMDLHGFKLAIKDRMDKIEAARAADVARLRAKIEAEAEIEAEKCVRMTPADLVPTKSVGLEVRPKLETNFTPPSSINIVGLVSREYQVSTTTARNWLASMNFSN